MKWLRLKIRTTVEAEDILVGSMQDIGLFGAEIVDHVPLTAAEKEQMFVDILPDAADNDGTAQVIFYVEMDDDGFLHLQDEQAAFSATDAVRSGAGLEAVRTAKQEAALKQGAITPEQMRVAVEQKIRELRSYCDIIGEGTVTMDETADLDWMNNWKQYFHQFWIDDILVIPSWEEPETGSRTPAAIFRIDPGTAFGTGMHETTQLCIREIRKHLTPETVLLDVGTGSGILSVLALMLGAKEAVGTDLDPAALPAVQENLAANGVPEEKCRVILGNLTDDEATQKEVGAEHYDIAVANILPDILVPLTPAVVRALKPGGTYITSGIVEGREPEVADAMRECGLTDITVEAQGEWRCVAGKKPLI